MESATSVPQTPRAAVVLSLYADSFPLADEQTESRLTYFSSSSLSEDLSMFDDADDEHSLTSNTTLS